MKVTFDPDRCHQAVFDDDDFQFVIEQAAKSRQMLMFVASAIRDFENHKQLVHGKPGSGRNMESVANSFLKGKRARESGVALSRKLAILYERFDPGIVRGCLIESMVEGQLRARYVGSELDNNVFIKLENSADYQTSTSVDVAGYDGDRGEAHDCKAKGRSVETSFIDELVESLSPHGFRIGVATAESTRTAAQGMSRGGYRVPSSVTIAGPEQWWDGLPLWAA